MDVASELRIERARRKISQKKAAERIGVSPRTVARWESGHLKGVTLGTVSLIARFLGVELQEVVDSLEVL